MRGKEVDASYQVQVTLLKSFSFFLMFQVYSIVMHFLKKFILFIFIFGCVGSLLLYAGFL